MIQSPLGSHWIVGSPPKIAEFGEFSKEETLFAAIHLIRLRGASRRYGATSPGIRLRPAGYGG